MRPPLIKTREISGFCLRQNCLRAAITSGKWERAASIQEWNFAVNIVIADVVIDALVDP